MTEQRQRKTGQKQNYVYTGRYALTKRELAARKRMEAA